MADDKDNDEYLSWIQELKDFQQSDKSLKISNNQT